MPGWVWILLVVVALLAFGRYYDWRRRAVRGLERPASTGRIDGRTPRDARLDARGEGGSSGSGV